MTITAFLSRSPGLLNLGPGGLASVGCWFSLPHLISNWLNFLCTELYNSLTPTFFLWVSQIAHIQPNHGQGYILIFLDWMHLLFTQVHFLFWQPGRARGLYTSQSYYLPIAGGRIIGFIPFPRVLVLCEMQSASSRIWTRVAVSISYDDNHYTTGTSIGTRHYLMMITIEVLIILWNRIVFWVFKRVLLLLYFLIVCNDQNSVSLWKIPWKCQCVD